MSISIGGHPISRVPKNERDFDAKVGKTLPPQIPTKGMTSLTQEELKAKARELGTNIINASSEKEKQAIMDEFTNYQKQYISLVSPDRKSLYEDAMKAIAKQGAIGQQKIEKPDTPKNLFDFLNERDGLGEFAKKRGGIEFDKKYSFPGGGSFQATYVTGGGASFDVSKNGQPLLNINMGCVMGNGVSYYQTDAEFAMQKEFGNIFQQARESAKWNNANGYNTATDGGLDVKA